MSVAISWANKMQLAKCDIMVSFPISSQISLVYEISLLSQAVLKHVVSKDFFFKKFVQLRDPAKNEEISGIVPYQNFPCHVTFKKKISTCGLQVGHMWVTSRLFCESVSQ